MIYGIVNLENLPLNKQEIKALVQIVDYLQLLKLGEIPRNLDILAIAEKAKKSYLSLFPKYYREGTYTKSFVWPAEYTDVMVTKKTCCTNSSGVLFIRFRPCIYELRKSHKCNTGSESRYLYNILFPTSRRFLRKTFLKVKRSCLFAF
jgi:hypothetical protein